MTQKLFCKEREKSDETELVMTSFSIFKEHLASPSDTKKSFVKQTKKGDETELVILK